MTEAAHRHFVHCVRDRCQLVGQGLEDPLYTLKLCELAQQVVQHVTPGKGDSMDILSYIKVKRIPGGQISDSQWVDGVVFTGDIVHRKMRGSIPNCHLALLQESLSFDTEKRLTRLDDLRRQEADFMDLKVHKIADDLQPKPELLLCQGSVSQIAQEKLRQKNISVVLGVPPHILSAVARSTGAKVLHSVDSVVRCTAGGKNAVVGRCQSFSVRRVGGNGAKPLVFVEGSRSEEQCFSTVCLRGGEGLPEAEAMALLTSAKRTLHWAIRLARHLQLESELLFEMWCEPRPRRGPVPPTEGGMHKNPNLPKGPEYLDVVCYSVSKNEEKTCRQPCVLRLPAYGTQPQRPWPAAGAPPPGFPTPPGALGWAGGLDTKTLDGFRDCTMKDWLARCLGTAGPSAPTTQMFLEDFRQPMPVLAADATSVLDASGMVVWSRSSATNSAAGSRLREPPFPTKSEQLYFQHRGSRVKIVLNDIDELRSGPAASIPTRWSLLSSEEEDERGQDADGGRAVPPGAGPQGAGGRARGAAAGESEVTFHWWCVRCSHPVTHRYALSSQAMWYSFTRFLEMMLHNSTSMCSSLANAGCSCGMQAAFRNYWLFCSNTQQPNLVVGFKWEPVQMYELHPPHLPFWEVQQRALNMGEDASWGELQRLLHSLKELLGHIGSLIRCVLMALSASDDMLPNLGSEEGPGQGRSPAVARLEDAGEVQGPEWLAQWVWESRGDWHRALKQLSGLHAALGRALKTAELRLQADPEAPEANPACDPVLVAFVRRDLLDSFRHDTLRSAEMELKALRKRHMPDEERKAAGRSPAVAFALPRRGRIRGLDNPDPCHDATLGPPSPPTAESHVPARIGRATLPARDRPRA